MTAAGLRLARRANAVAQLHGETARRMWADVEDAAPLIAITNGVHVGTWQDSRMPGAGADDESLLALHRTMKEELLAEVQRRACVRLGPGVLTVGFARRAAAYKRPDLLLRDPARLAPLLEGGQLQLVFAGKAHPADQGGKALVARLVQTLAQWPKATVFLENY